MRERGVRNKRCVRVIVRAMREREKEREVGKEREREIDR